MPTEQARAGASVAQLKDKISQTKQDIRELGSAAQDAASQSIDQFYQQGSEKARQAQEGLESRIRNRPLQSVLIAAGVGFVAGYLLSRRS